MTGLFLGAIGSEKAADSTAFWVALAAGDECSSTAFCALFRRSGVREFRKRLLVSDAEEVS